MKKLLFIFGTRPEAIKMAPVIKECKLEAINFECKVCVTAQHREMLDQVLSLFEIKPDYDLNIMQANQNLHDLTASILSGLNEVIKEYKPDIVLVHGDTTTTFSSTLASFYHKVDVAHIEAGLRTYNLFSPWPEEANRKLTSVLAKYHFAPTLNSKNNLIKEGINEDLVFVTGNTVIDSLNLVLEKILKNSKLLTKIKNDLSIFGINDFNRDFLLITGHRRENFGKGFENICHALKTIAENNKDLLIIFPVHLNPAVRGPVKESLKGLSNIILMDPLEYEQFVYLMYKSKIILTDSGGIQEEATCLGKPVLVMRDTTERPEGIASGSTLLIGTEKESIIRNVEHLLKSQDDFLKMSKSSNTYGDGNASKKIINVLR